MSSRISRVDSQLDRLQFFRQFSSPSSPELNSALDGVQGHTSVPRISSDLARTFKLQAAIKTLSTASSSRALLPSQLILAALAQVRTLEHAVSESAEHDQSTAQEQELEWLLVSKAATQTYGLILNVLLEQTLPLNNEIGYWNEILSSYRYTAFYTIQTSPLRLWSWVSDIYSDSWQRLRSIRSAGNQEVQEARTFSDRWIQFYSLVEDSMRDRSLADVQSRILSPLTISRMEARSKRQRLNIMREMSASGLGILMDEGMDFDVNDEDSISSKSRSTSQDEWQGVVAKSVALIETVLGNITVLELGTGDFEETVFMNIDNDSRSMHHDAEHQSRSQTAKIRERLENILQVYLPAHIAASTRLVRKHGRPSRLIRYWLPGLTLVFSSGTLLRIFVNRKAEIVTWIRDLGDTTIDFWYNWVVEPLKKVIGTIRHDKDTEIAIMSKESLQGDRASLERMVVDFAMDNSNSPHGARLTEVEVAEVRAKVREGDLTPVLRAYERDLRKPFMSTIRGDLVRALLIQIQKTKVDVEVAVSGIDSLLKSQELVFGSVFPPQLMLYHC